MVLTVLEGKRIGEKVLTADGRIVWESRVGEFFQAYQKELQQLTDSGSITLGGVNVFCDVLGQEKAIVICGGGHVSIPVIELGIMMGCEVTVLEDRPTFADNARRAGATRASVSRLRRALRRWPEVQIPIL